MYYYRYVRSGDPQDGQVLVFSVRPAKVGAGAVGDYQYLVEIDVPPELLVEAARQETIAKINTDAGASRSKFITVIPGQETTYAEKRTEAQAYQRSPNPQASDYPMLAAEATATGRTMADVATEVLTLAAQWRQLGAHIEGVRRGAIVQVQKAQTVEEVEAVRWMFP